ncbi:SAM-dependent methyltransferase [Bifidobacterium catenulatum subsp. kashiwanohense]|uniref:THUMP-like domain-containing protein n=1 Tax=Bifidobacterium catenulatum TaxID=1686 RepID=UPI003D05ECF4
MTIMNDKTREFVAMHRDEDVRELALKAKRVEGLDLPLALDQIAGWQIASKKLPQWASCEGIIYPPHISMEQCSSQFTAQYKSEIAQTLLVPATTVRARVSDSPELGNYEAGMCLRTSDSPESDTQEVKMGVWMTDSPESDTLVAKRAMVDLTGGFGVDFSYLARGFNQATYVERQRHLCDLAEHNMAALGLDQARIVCGDGVEYLRQMDPVDFIYLDPTRRDEHGARTYAIEDCMPNVLELRDLLLAKSQCTLVKLSPMLDWRKAVADFDGAVREVHIVATGNECKELLLVLGRPAQADALDGVDGAGSHRRPAAHARVEQMNGGMDSAGTVDSFDGESKAERTAAASHDGRYAAPHMFCVNDNQRIDYDSAAYTQGLRIGGKPLPEVKNYLYEPNASIMKAGCFDLVEERFGVTQIGPSSHLFVSEQQIADFPGRGFAIEAVGSMNKKDTKRLLNGVKQANIAVRNFPLTAPQLRKKLKLADGGTVYLFGTTMQGGDHVLLRTSKI